MVCMQPDVMQTPSRTVADLPVGTGHTIRTQQQMFLKLLTARKITRAMRIQGVTA